MTASIQAEPGRRADGPEPTRQERIEQHVHLVHRAARRVLGVLPAHVDDAEVIGYGILGLLEALDRDGETEGPAFEAAASRTIWQRIVEALSEMDWLGAAGRERVRALVRAHSELAAELGRPATEEELASHLAVAADQLCEWLEQASRVFATSLDQFVWIEYRRRCARNIGHRLQAVNPICYLLLQAHHHLLQPQSHITQSTAQDTQLVLAL